MKDQIPACCKYSSATKDTLAQSSSAMKLENKGDSLLIVIEKNKGNKGGVKSAKQCAIEKNVGPLYSSYRDLLDFVCNPRKSTVALQM